MHETPSFPTGFAAAVLRAAQERIATLKREIEEREREIQQLRDAPQFFAVPSTQKLSTPRSDNAPRQAAPLSGNSEQIHSWLSEQGPHTLADIKRELKLPNSSVHGALIRGEGVHFRRDGANRWSAITTEEGEA